MVVTTDECRTLDLVDLGDASIETRQVWFGTLPDSVFGLGFFRD
jgi:hypothetical protein